MFEQTPIALVNLSQIDKNPSAEELRRYDVLDFSSVEEARETLDSWELINMGSFAMLFKHPTGQRVYKVPLYNSLGQEWTLKRVKNNTFPVAQQKRAELTMSNVASSDPNSYELMCKEHERDIFIEAQVQNKAYISNSSKTVPVNQLLTINGQVLGIGMKYLEGRRASSYDEAQEMVPDFWQLNRDTNYSNVIVSSDLHSPIQAHVIDFDNVALHDPNPDA